MKWFKKMSLVAAASLVAVSTLVGSASAASGLSGKITINGSTALLPLTLQAAKEFQKLNPKVRIAASGKGSVTGPQAVKKGIADIGACDWDASMDVPGFKAFDGQVANKVAVIPFATIVNKNVKVNNLTTEQLKGIYSGKITNWKEVGGDNADIVVITRAFGSGTRVNYQAKALGGGDIVKKDKNYKEVGSSGDMKTAVATTPNAIGYIDLVYVNSDLKAVSFNGVLDDRQRHQRHVQNLGVRLLHDQRTTDRRDESVHRIRAKPEVSAGIAQKAEIHSDFGDALIP